MYSDALFKECTM